MTRPSDGQHLEYEHDVDMIGNTGISTEPRLAIRQPEFCVTHDLAKALELQSSTRFISLSQAGIVTQLSHSHLD